MNILFSIIMQIFYSLTRMKYYFTWNLCNYRKFMTQWEQMQFQRQQEEVS